ncbi:SusC/RagA family TonB-linked outer membrane protein [Parapedobacter koreensis]|uniref:TonB-linked outer membrane protein, SusC/RagA family n=1 Tax=Parapedobacter koreensis TaxID=332977 RepID=A0A1H7M982_9SPHI|nr:SusC/RagA family TonB-linked outer membrane protein [Parapedobacter koreensis]SEL07806.1 TonB-linked outer membrane protein, SusC/RagA family [Parapedobacter koreensis]
MKHKVHGFILLCCMLLCSVAYTQERRISGRVSGPDGGPMAGVTVVATGTSSGVTTDDYGRYTISIPAGTESLTFRFIGYTPKVIAVGTSNVLDAALSPDPTQLAEVVVTGAYGIKATSRSASHNAQVVSQEQMNTIRQTDINNALAGKVTGIQVRSQSPAALGRETEVRLRGMSGFSQGMGAIYVVDGTILPNINDINLDDIDNVSVLQGPAAAAQFGSQGANGAIVITLRKGRQTPGVGVTVNLGAQFDNVYVLPAYQNLYAGGANASLTQYTWQEGHPEAWRALDGKYYHDMQDDASWGPRMEGQEYIPWYAWYGGHSRSYQTASLMPQPNNARDFFETGVTLNNGITFSSSTEKLDFKTTFNNQTVNGLLPESSMSKNNLNVVTTYRLNDKLALSANINYINRELNGLIQDSYGSTSTGSFNQWFHRDLDIDILRELRGLNHNGIYGSWNKRNPNAYDPSSPDEWYRANYWYNPYTQYDFNPISEQNDRLFGDVSFTYKIIDGLSVKGTYRKQQNTYVREARTYTELENSAYQTGVFGAYATQTSYQNRENLEFLASYDKTFNDFSVNANLGTDFFNAVYRSNGANTNQGLTVPNGFFISNSVQSPTIENTRWNEKYNAVFGTAVLGYKDMLFANVTLRNDWFSTLPSDNNDVLSKSFGGSFVFTELLPGISWLSFGKVRYSWGEIPQALGESRGRFGAYRYPGMAYSIGNNQWNGNILMPTPDQLVDPNIHGAVNMQQEMGIDLRFLSNRLGASFTYWNGKDRDFPFSLTVNGASGFTSLLTNIGEIKKEGVEIQLTAQPVVKPGFRWDVNFTYSHLIRNDVVEVSEEYLVTRSNSVANVAFGNLPQAYHEKGMRSGQLIGRGILRNDDGVPILNSNGSYQVDPEVFYGSVLPDFTGGIQNSFNFLNDFYLAFNIDYQFGGVFASLSDGFGAYSGLSARTAVTNDKGMNVRDAVEDGGGIKVVGVNANNEPVEYYVDVRTHYVNIFNNGTVDEYIHPLDFIKLREVSLGYDLPVNKWNLRRLGVQNANFSIVGRNLWLIHSKANGDYDPSEISSFAGETAQLPGTRGWGFNLRVGF